MTRPISRGFTFCPFSLHVSEGCLWFRVFGYGLSAMDREKHKPLFSTRKRGEYRIGRWGFHRLYPD